MLIDILLTIHFILLVLVSLRVLSRDELTAPARLDCYLIRFTLFWRIGLLDVR